MALNSETYISIRQQEKELVMNFTVRTHCSEPQIQIQLQKHDIFYPRCWNYKTQF